MELLKWSRVEYLQVEQRSEYREHNVPDDAMHAILAKWIAGIFINQTMHHMRQRPPNLVVWSGSVQPDSVCI